jgi:hypothetical protein
MPRVDRIERVADALESIANGFGGGGFIPLSLGSLLKADTGVVLAVFADGASDVPGTQLTNSEALTIRWNNHAAPLAVGTQFPYPRDIDTSFPMVFNTLVSKTGATSGDATSLTVTAFNSGVVGALHDADADFGGATDAVSGTLAAKTVSRLQRTLAAADLAAYPASMSITFKPTAGTLGTDDLLLHAAWLTYTRSTTIAS